MSGLGVPLRTLMPIMERARSTRLPACTLPCSISLSSAESARITMSNCSPRAMRLGMESGALPMEAPRSVTTLLPVACS